MVPPLLEVLWAENCVSSQFQSTALTEDPLLSGMTHIQWVFCVGRVFWAMLAPLGQLWEVLAAETEAEPTKGQPLQFDFSPCPFLLLCHLRTLPTKLDLTVCFQGNRAGIVLFFYAIYLFLLLPFFCLFLLGFDFHANGFWFKLIWKRNWLET